MLIMADAGVKPCATTEEPNETNNDCAFCAAPVDGFGAERSVAVCYSCTEVNP